MPDRVEYQVSDTYGESITVASLDAAIKKCKEDNSFGKISWLTEGISWLTGLTASSIHTLILKTKADRWDPVTEARFEEWSDEYAKCCIDDNQTQFFVYRPDDFIDAIRQEAISRLNIAEVAKFLKENQNIWIMDENLLEVIMYTQDFFDDIKRTSYQKIIQDFTEDFVVPE